MLLHNFKYMFCVLMKQKALIFWTFAFPLIMGIFFQLAFSNIEKAETFDIIDIAIVDNEHFQNDAFMKEAFKTLGDENSDDRMFNIQYTDKEKAEKLLSAGDIDGYLISYEDNNAIVPKVVISKNGTNQTIFKSAVEEIIQTSDMVNKAITSNAALNNQVTELIMQGLSEEEITAVITGAIAEVIDSIQNIQVNIKDVSGDNLSYIVIEFYTLIAMTCLYGGIIGMTAMNLSLANMSNNGKRVAMSPAKKSGIILSSTLAGYVVQLIGIAILFLFSIFVLKVDFGDNIPLVILLAAVGCLAGLTLGIAVATLFKAGEGVKIGIILAISMVGCFLSGMMGVVLKYYIDKGAPLVNKLNPAAMITDGYYSLYYYDTLDRYLFNLTSLLIFSAVMLIISWRGLRRQQYDSI